MKNVNSRRSTSHELNSEILLSETEYFIDCDIFGIMSELKRFSITV